MARQTLRRGGARSISRLIWDGDGRNPNAALTMFRHFDSATVVQGSGRRAAEDGVGHRLPAVRAHLLPAGRRLRRLRQRRPPAEQPPVHGLPAHGRRVQLPRAAAGESSTLDGRILVSRRAQGGDRLRLRPQGALQPAETASPTDQRSATRTVRNAERASGAGARRSASIFRPVADPALRRDLQALSNVRGASLAWLPEVVFLRVERPAGSAAVLQCAAQHRAQATWRTCSRAGAAAGGEHADGGTGLPRRLSERDFQRQGSGPARARECHRVDGVGSRLPQARRSLRDSPHQPALLGHER